MRIQEIHIRGFRVLDDFSLDFKRESQMSDSSTSATQQVSHTLDLLVGVNGTGKSTLLRAIAEIFQRLENEEQPDFGFAIHYETRNYPQGIFISNINERSEDAGQDDVRLPLRFREGEQEEKRVSVIDPKYLPDWIIAFTSGSEEGWIAQRRQDEDNNKLNEAVSPATLREHYLSELPGPPVDEAAFWNTDGQEIKNRFLFISADSLPLVVLCGLLAERLETATQKGQSESFLRQALKACKITDLRGFSLKFRINFDPAANRTSINDNASFIRSLGQLAQQTIQTGSDYLLVFALETPEETLANSPTPHTVNLAHLRQLQGTWMGFLRRLIQLQHPGNGMFPILRKVNLFFEENRTDEKKQERSPLHLFDWLSDGEQSFLGRLCLFALPAEKRRPHTSMSEETHTTSVPEERFLTEETLILLDEPEVHFNDYWKRKLVQIIVQAIRETPSHVLMTTHSSITLSDVAHQHIWVLQRSNDYTTEALPPNVRTLGTDPSDILVDVFGAENAVGAYSVDRILRTIADARRLGLNQADDRRRKLEDLYREVGPGYWRYIIRKELDSIGGDSEV